MRFVFSVIFLILSIALTVTAVVAARSGKKIGRSVAHLNGSLVMPVVGNMIIIASSLELFAIVGYYIYFLGMNFVMHAVLSFTFAYCRVSLPTGKIMWAVRVLLIVDSVQLLCNLAFGHAFGLNCIVVDGTNYYQLIPYVGQAFHRIVDYSIFFFVLIVFFVMVIRSSKIESERYLVILLTMVVTGIWETAYIISRTPVDRSMLGFGVFGLLIFYFSLYYRPLRLLDRLLATIASRMPEALYFFDANSRCIWANEPGIQLAGITDGNYEQIPPLLVRIFGQYERSGEDWSVQQTVRSKGSIKSYMMEKHAVRDDRNRNIGSFLSIRDNTAEQERLQKEIFNATHDSLTGVYNRAGYDFLLANINLRTTFMILMDIDRFKDVNDTWGHEVGDRVLQRTVKTVKKYFRLDDYVCRIGGDEFVVLMAHVGEEQQELIAGRLKKINEELTAGTGQIPSVSISAGIASGRYAADAAEWFKHADEALYAAKRAGRNGFTFYVPPEETSEEEQMEKRRRED